MAEGNRLPSLENAPHLKTDGEFFRKPTRPSLPLKKETFLPLRLSCKESFTFLTKPLFNSLYDPFGSPYRGQKPFSESKDVTALCAVFLKSSRPS